MQQQEPDRESEGPCVHGAATAVRAGVQVGE